MSGDETKAFAVACSHTKNIFKFLSLKLEKSVEYRVRGQKVLRPSAAEKYFFGLVVETAIFLPVIVRANSTGKRKEKYFFVLVQKMPISLSVIVRGQK